MKVTLHGTPNPDNDNHFLTHKRENVNSKQKSKNLDVDMDSEGVVTKAGALLMNIKLKENLNIEIYDSFEKFLRQTVFS